MLIWPLPAVLTWGVAWAVFGALRALGLEAWAPWAALLVSAGLAWWGSTVWRRVFMFAGFPLSLLVSGWASGQGAGMPAAGWLVPVVLLLWLYPRRTWGDAPLFPTPARALGGLAQAAPLPDGAAVLDAGCGLGAGLLALQAQYPRARLAGWEWSWPLAVLCRLRCRFAQVRRADIWAQSWQGQDLVYLFQRPESMERALLKASQELAPGAWVVSLEFEAAGWTPQARLETVPGKPVWVYRAPFQRRTAPADEVSARPATPPRRSGRRRPRAAGGSAGATARPR
ncbi:MAG: class I SAM-dependent methyltransferase [Hydrogenophaga sp.]|nr:class I SAM-dependent methyltransferase [Hydrogenophaga sp.]